MATIHIGRCKSRTKHEGRERQCQRDEWHEGDHEKALGGGKRISWPSPRAGY